MPARGERYRIAAERLRELGRDGRSSDDDRMRRVADVLWEELRDAGVSWVGFYTVKGDAMVLGPCRSKPACSPIGLHGVCGQALISGAPRIVRDVKDLGDAYVACDPRDRSEVVVPLLHARRAAEARSEHAHPAWAVLDLDSWSVGAFDESDAAGLADVLEVAGFVPARTAGRAG
jgi:putative methionine-R-sulfoxide reductase with GAF domain